jgi:hypothetical protein
MDVGGSTWTSDGNALLQLDAGGVVSKVLGEPPDLGKLGEIAALSVTANGRIHAVDERTGAVHVFDERGIPERVCRPDVRDYQGKLFLPSLTVSDSGDIFVSRRDLASNFRPDFLHYDPKCVRIGIESVAVEGVTQSWLSQPGTSNRWVVGYKSVYLIDARNSVLRRMDRTASNEWLQDLGPGATAPDGSVAIASSGRLANERVVTLYSPDATALRTWVAPRRASTVGGAMAFDGRYLAFVTHSDNGQRADSVVITDTQGVARFRLPLSDARYGAAVAFVNRGEAQLWVFDGASKIDSFAIP